MASLSIDTVFCVMEYLPVRDALNCLFVCKDWHSIDRYEIFWKMNYQRYVISNIVELFQALKKEVNYREEHNLEELLFSLQNESKKKRTIHEIRKIKSNSGQKNNPLFVVKRSVFQSMLTAYETHILNDRTATRDSFIMIFNHDSQQTENNIRFKYLMEKQVLAKSLVLNSSFFTSLRTNFPNIDEIVVKFLTIIMGEDFMRNTGNSTSNFNQEEMLLEYRIFRNILRPNNSENNYKYWQIMMGLSLEWLPKLIPVQYLPEILNAMFDSQKYQAKIDWLSIICSRYEYYRDQCDLIVELMKRNGVDPNVLPLIDEHFISCPKKAICSIKYLYYLKHFRTIEEITTLATQSYYFKSFLSQLTLLVDDSLSEFLDNCLIPVDKIPIDTMGLFPKSNFLKILEYAKEKGFIFPQSTVEYLLSNQLNYSRQHSNIVKFIMDNYNCDVYEIDRRVKFFHRFLESLSHSSLSNIEEEFQMLFSDEPIDLTRLYQVKPGVNGFALWILANFKNPLAFVEFCKKRFIQNVFNLATVQNLLSSGQFEYYKNNSTIKRIIYENATYEENIKLTDYISTQLNENPELFNETTLDFRAYSIKDPKFAISFHLYLNH